MKRWLGGLFIAGYLFVLSAGVFCHAVSYKVGAHPGMYFIVWDMFCGWQAYSTRLHIIGEGESGAMYELAPGPWGEYKPFGSIGRRHYDGAAIHSARLAINCLKHTKHEPISRIFAVEENWPKKFNMPDRLWKKHYPGEKDKLSYFQTRFVFSRNGNVLQTQPTWLAAQAHSAVSNNPRLHAEVARASSFFTVDRRNRLSDPRMADELLNNAPSITIGSPLGQ